MEFKKATKSKAKLRLAIIGPAGAGKTYSALSIASGMGERIAVIDTEHGSASKYADLFAFDSLEPDLFSPQTYVEAIQTAERADYEVLVIDSLSHAWSGKGGALEMVDAASIKSKSGSSFHSWREVTPHHMALVEAMVTSKCHVIATMRSKMEYVQEKDERGKTTIKKLGLAPIQRDGLEYEFDLVGDMDSEHRFAISKSRIPAFSGQVIQNPGKPLAAELLKWLNSGVAKAPTMPPITNNLEDRGRATALLGVDALRNWWRSLLPHEREAVKPLAEQLRLIAVAADSKDTTQKGDAYEG